MPSAPNTDASAEQPKQLHRAPLGPVKLPTRKSLRWVLVTPTLALIALATLMAVMVWYLTETEESQRAQALMRDVDITQRAIHDRLRRNEDEVSKHAKEFALKASPAELKKMAERIFSKSDDIIFVAWIDQQAIVRGVHTSQGIPRQVFDPVGSPLRRDGSRASFDYAIGSKKTSYSSPIRTREAGVEVDMHTPILKDNRVVGTLVASYALPNLLLETVSAEINNRIVFSLVNAQGQILAETRRTSTLAGRPFYEVALEPMPLAVKLRGYSSLPVSSLFNDVVITLVGGLIILAVISQIVIWRNTRQRINAESELAEETAFRRAMENSMSTGMRVIDPDGFITYVNPAFSRMVGFSVDDLTGCGPPYPYWPPETRDQLQKNLDRMLAGKSPPSGLPIQIMRKDGTRLTVRMYTSPLIDQSGDQTGWMTSVTDISEQTRIRQELAQAQERFITVLQALDAAVSVAAPSAEDELLFANQAYKKWFGNSLVNGHRFLCDGVRGSWSDVREVFSPLVQRWFEVRVSSIQWVDGGEVELMVATDITQERANEQAQREQHEKLQQTSRLITMGEMASSLAHELNQPLSAIANYTSGAAARLRSALSRGERVPDDELLDMLTKTSRQAERAGQVIRRIRGFVKRSDPIRKPVAAHTILADTLGLAEIDARERGLEIVHEIAPGLPLLNVDAILIEQVLLNLIKNGLDAMKDSKERVLQVRVGLADSQQVFFSVKDYGHGVPEEISGRLFDSFYTTKADGMGMGLNICRSIIESHHGRLWFENSPEGGCTFRFTLPVLPVTDSDPHPAQSIPSTQSSQSTV